MLEKFKLGFLKDNVEKTLKRFPLQIIYLLIINWLIIYLVNSNSSSLEEWKIISLILTLILSFFLSIWIKFFNETIKNNYIKIINYILLIVFWVLFYKYNTILDFGNYEIISYFLTAICIFCFMFFSPYIKQIIKNDLNQNIFYTFIYKISVIILNWMILWLVLLILWSLSLITIENLFNLNTLINQLNLYENWMTLAICFFPALYCLSKLPQKDEILQEHLNENKFMSFLIKYISIPFIYIYFIILYTYTIKVIINFNDWPKWEVSWLVIAFSIFWYIIYLFSYIHQENNKFIKVFRTFFPYVVLPQIFMLFYSIYLRINQYDLTINRYLTVVFWITLAIISLYFIFSKKKNLHCIMIIISVITILISIWPWWIFSLPETRQENQLKKLLIQYNVVNEKGEVDYEAWKKIPQVNKNDINSRIQYLCWLNNCRSIAKIFPNEYEDIKINYYNWLSKEERSNNPLPDKWTITSDLTKKLNLEYSYINDKDDEYIRLNLEYWQYFPINISGYSKIYEIKYDWKEDWDYWYLNSNSNLVIKIDNVEKNYDISDINKKLIELNKKKSKFSIDDLSFDLDNNTRIIFTSHSIKTKSFWVKIDKNYSSYTTWYILTK